MSASLDYRLLEAPLSDLTAVEIPMAILLRRRVGGLNEAEATHAAITSLATCVTEAIESGNGYELVAFINAMADTIHPERRIQQPAVGFGTARDFDDASNRMVIVLGKSGSPVTDGDGRQMIFSLKELYRLATLSGETHGAVAH